MISDHDEDHCKVLFRKVRGILNKLTPDKFDKLSDQLINLGLNTPYIIKGVILLIYDKALEETKYSTMYAQLCYKLSEQVMTPEDKVSIRNSPNLRASQSTTFYKLLLAKCRDEFENRYKAAEAFEDGPLTPEEEEQKSLAKHKMLGNIKFICELGKQRLVQENILHSCIHQLCRSRKKVAEPIQSKAEDLECLCQIMKTIGCLLDTPEAKPLMDQYFERMEKFSQNQELPSRIRFMLQDVLELRNNKWVPRRIQREQNPKTIVQIRAEAAKDFGMSTLPSGSHHHQPHHPNAYPLGYFNPINSMPMRQSHFGSGPNQMLIGHVQAGQRALDDLYSSPLVPYGINSSLTSPAIGGFADQQELRQKLQNNLINMNSILYHQAQQQSQQQNHQSQFHHHSSQLQTGQGFTHVNSVQGSGGMGGSNGQPELPPRFQRMMHGQHQHHPHPHHNQHHHQRINHVNPLIKNQSQQQHDHLSSVQRAIHGGTNIPPQTINSNSHEGRQQPMQNKPFIPATNHFTSSNRNEISLRPAENSIMHKHNLALNKNKTETVKNMTMISTNSNIKAVDPHYLSYHTQNSGKIIKANEIQTNLRNKNQTNKGNILKSSGDALEDYISGKSDTDDVIRKISELEIPKNFQNDVITSMIRKSLSRSESDRESVSKLLSKLHSDKLFSTNVFMSAFKDLSSVLDDLEIDIPRAKSHLAGFLARAIVDDLISLKDVYEIVEGGQYYPLLLLCLQHLHLTQGDKWLSETFERSKINLLMTLPEIDRVKERLADILRERDLSFLEPLLRIEFDMSKHLGSPNASPNSLFSWIQSNVDTELRGSPGFINVLFTCVAKCISERAKQAASDAAFNEGDSTGSGLTNVREHEKDLLSKFATVFNAFVRDRPDLQLVLLYSLQSYWFALGCPKEMLLRWFVLIYDLDIVEDDVFFKWKEDINDEYPGKQQALFQVNKWFEWLEKVDDSEEEEEGIDSGTK